MIPPISFSTSTKIEKEKKEHARQHGMIRTEISGAEIAEEMEKERRLFQLQMCEVSQMLIKTFKNYLNVGIRKKYIQNILVQVIHAKGNKSNKSCKH